MDLDHFVRGGIVAFDCETTGLHWGNEPFCVSFCNSFGETLVFEWGVDPLTREVVADPDLLDEIRPLLENPHVAKVGHNIKHDVRAISRLGLRVQGVIHDTLFSAHICDSARVNHKLKSLAEQYLLIPAEDEKELKSAVVACRKVAKSLGWKIGEDVEEDYWLPREISLFFSRKGLPAHPKAAEFLEKWPNLSKLCSIYCIKDSERTMLLHKGFQDEAMANDAGLIQTYEREQRLWPVVYEMETRGVRVSKQVVNEEIQICRKVLTPLREKLVTQFGDFNKKISDVRMRKYLFGAEADGGCGFTPNPRYLTEKTRQPQVGAKAVVDFIHAPGLAAKIQYDRYTKALNTYFMNYLRMPVLESDIAPTYVTKIISGGQTGADQGGLEAAEALGLIRGGWMPKGYRTLNGSNPSLASRHGLVEHPSSSYPPRTEENVKSSDGTIRFAANFMSPGELCTIKLVRKHAKPEFSVDVNDPPSHASAREWLIENDIKTLNVAGNSEQTSPGIQSWVKTYLETVLSSEQEWVIHASFNQIGPDTGRCSMREPSLHNVPKRAKEGDVMKRVRRPFGPRKGYIWLHCDYKAIEARVFAEEANETDMLRIFAEGGDVYVELVRRVAAALYPAIAEWSLEEAVAKLDALFADQGGARQVCKNNFLGWTYGEGTEKLAKTMQLPMAVAMQVVAALKSAYPRAQLFMKHMQQVARRDRCIRNRYGRKVMIPTPKLVDGRLQEFYYIATNYIIQSTAADLLKEAMIRVHSFLQKSGRDAHLVMSVHDELVIEIKREHASRPFLEKIASIMGDNQGMFKSVRTPTDSKVTLNQWSDPKDVSVLWEKEGVAA